MDKVFWYTIIVIVVYGSTAILARFYDIRETTVLVEDQFIDGWYHGYGCARVYETPHKTVIWCE